MGRFQPVQQNGVAAGGRATTPSSVDGGVQRPGAGSPSPSLTSEKTLIGEELLEKQKKDEEDRMRCTVSKLYYPERDGEEQHLR